MWSVVCVAVASNWGWHESNAGGSQNLGQQVGREVRGGQRRGFQECVCGEAGA